MELQQKIDRITDILRRDDGISGAMHYTEQISWILFLKFPNNFEEEKEGEALLNNTKYERIISSEFRWNHWACPKTEEGKPDVKTSKTGGDLNQFVNGQLFPYLKGFKNSLGDPKSVKYKIGNIFEFLDNRIASGHTLREVLDIIDTLNFQSQDELFELSHVYENLLQGMGSDGGNSGEFYTPRAVIKAVVEALAPQPGQTVYDGAAGSCGFLIEAFDYIVNQYRNKLSTEQWQFLHENTFFGNEKTPMAYTMGVMNMILHGIESPNILKQNTLTANTGYIAIDAGNNADNVSKELIKLNINPDQITAVLFTHTDGDHVAALKLFKNAEVYLSRPEEDLLNGKKSRFLFFGNSIDAKQYTVLNDGQILNIGNIKIKGILTPGHTPGSMCYLINDKYLFLGDALSLKEGKIARFNEFFNMNTKTAIKSIVKITEIPETEYLLTAHYGYSDDYKDAVSDWGKSIN